MIFLTKSLVIASNLNEKFACDDVDYFAGAHYLKPTWIFFRTRSSLLRESGPHESTAGNWPETIWNRSVTNIVEATIPNRSAHDRCRAATFTLDLMIMCVVVNGDNISACSKTSPAGAGAGGTAGRRHRGPGAGVSTFMKTTRRKATKMATAAAASTRTISTCTFYSFVRWMVLFAFCGLAHYLMVSLSKYTQQQKLSSTPSSMATRSSAISSSNIALNPQRRLLKVPAQQEQDEAVDHYGHEQDDGVEYFFQLPPSQTATGPTGPTTDTAVFDLVQGIVLLFHGCTHNGIDWFQLPEDRRIVQTLLGRGFAVVSISSLDRTNHKCWTTRSAPVSDTDIGHTNPDVYRIIQTLPQLWTEMVKYAAGNAESNILDNDNTNEISPSSTQVVWPKTKLYGIGASSGGDFVSLLSQHVPFYGLSVMIAPGSKKAWAYISDLVSTGQYGTPSMMTLNDDHPDEGQQPQPQQPWSPRIAFVYMPRDERYGSIVNIEQSVLELQQVRHHRGDHLETATTTKEKEDISTSSIPVKIFACHPIPVTTQTFTKRMGVKDSTDVNVQSGNSAYLTIDEATLLVEKLASTSSLNAIDDATNLLTKDPRRIWSDIETIIYEVYTSRQPQQKRQKQQSADNGLTRTDDQEHQANQQNQKGLSLLVESIREILNVCYGQHEMTSQHIDDVVEFWLSASDRDG